MGIGVALAGGGLKGLAHIGALKALEELGVKIDYLSGTSSGSIFATTYALGFSVDEIKNITMQHYKELIKIEKTRILKAGATYVTTGFASAGGMINGKVIENMVSKFEEKKQITNMNELKLPFAITTVDTISTKECIFLSGGAKKIEDNDKVDYIYNAPIHLATRASMSFPGIYTTCNYGKYNFIDGGTKDNLPVKVLEDMGATKTIAISFRIDDYAPTEDIFGILLRTVDIFSLKDVRKAQEEATLAIEIDARDASLLEIKDPDGLIQMGYNTVMKYKEKILKLI